tara:strand:- start:774 stop:2048 length:1275 start_codon:yes stop_codon:yes gene_type:complete
MRNLFKKIFKNTKNLNNFNLSFNNLRKNFNSEKIFNSISKYSEKSEARYVGGCVRKILNKEEIDDIDLATNLDPSEITNVLTKDNINFFDSGIEHGTITAVLDNNSFEITSLRKDVSTDGRHAKVEFSDSWVEDSTRRDFTINSIYADIDGNLFDPHNGKKDLEEGIVKFIGEPEKRIKEDYLRILRYVRFYLNYSKHNHQTEVKKIIKQNLAGIKIISKERLLAELKKLVLSKGFLKLNDDPFCLAIIMLIFPELTNLNLFKNLNSFAKNLIHSKSFIFLISLMIIDDSDNVEYFIYKYNLSNHDKNKITFLKKIFSKKNNNQDFSEKNLWKILYLNNKDELIDMIDFQIFRSKKIDKKLINLKKLFMNKEKPVFPVKAKYLIDEFKLKEGVELGRKLKDIENTWINNSFKISNEEIRGIINS